MNKPKMKRSLVVDFILEDDGYITFFTARGIADELSVFGHMYPFDNIPNKYTLRIDPRYNFGEVLDYIQNYSNEKPEPFYVTPIIP